MEDCCIVCSVVFDSSNDKCKRKLHDDIDATNTILREVLAKVNRPFYSNKDDYICRECLRNIENISSWRKKAAVAFDKACTKARTERADIDIEPPPSKRPRLSPPTTPPAQNSPTVLVTHIYPHS